MSANRSVPWPSGTEDSPTPGKADGERQRSSPPGETRRLACPLAAQQPDQERQANQRQDSGRRFRDQFAWWAPALTLALVLLLMLRLCLTLILALALMLAHLRVLLHGQLHAQVELLKLRR